MNRLALYQRIQAGAVNRKELLRYASCPVANEETQRLLDEVIAEGLPYTATEIVYRILPVTVQGDECSFGEFSLTSHSLALHLAHAQSAVFFAATLGARLDRLIGRYLTLSPARALFMEALGNERIEAGVDLFCRRLAEEKKKPYHGRFSAGYGDLPLQTQEVFFRLLPTAKIGLSLTDRYLMTPSKSVTALMGL